MSKKKDKRIMKISLIILLVTWIVLLLLLAAVYVLHLQGYDSFKEWMDHKKSGAALTPGTPTPTKSLSEPTEAPTATPVPTQTPTEAPTATPIPTPTFTPTPTSTPTPTEPPVRTMVFSGNEAVDEKLRKQAEELFGTEEEVCYASFENGVFFSTVFQTEEEIVPVVYDLNTANQLSGSDLIKDTYFAIIKERLQTYVAENYPEEAEDEFISYDQIYQAEDYQKIYLTEDTLVFCFDAGTLSANHPAFSYACDLGEAMAFFKINFDGTANVPMIRELDPNAKMIAITFDDGPYPKVEAKILELFEQYNGRATFFCLGERIAHTYPDSPALLHAAGHEVASHTYSHEVNFATASNKDIWSEVNRTNLLIANATGYAPDYVRFPGGSVGKRALNVPMIVTNWNIDSIDYKYKKDANGPELIYKRVLNYMDVADGAIVLMHSLYQNTYESVKMYVEYLTEEGYELVTLSELFYYKGVTPEFGAVYKNGKGEISKKK